MRRIHLVAPLMLAYALSSSAMSFKAEIQPLKLPLMVSSSLPPKVKYTAPGQIDVGLMRMCGDGDVAHFSKEHPDFEFVPQDVKEMDVLVGYWLVEEGASSALPTKENFFPVGYRKSKIAENHSGVEYDGNFLPINHSAQAAPGVNGLGLLATDIINLSRMAQLAHGANKNFEIHAGVFTCLNPSEPAELSNPGDANYKFVPTPVEILHSLTSPQLLLQAAESAAAGPNLSNLNNFLNTNSKVRISLSIEPHKDTIYAAANYQPSTHAPYKFEIGPGSGDVIADLKSGRASALMNLFESISKLNYPTLTKTDPDERLQEYKSKMASEAIYSKLSSATGDKSSHCTNVGISVNKSKGEYKWEALPMNLTCKYLHKEGELATLFADLFQPNFLPSASEFSDAKLELARRYYVAAVFEGVQETMHNDNQVKVAKPSCFDTNKDMISRMVGSYPIGFNYNSSTEEYRIRPNVNNHVHPESLFALVDYKRYFDSPILGIFGQVLKPQEATNLDTKQWSIKLPLSDKLELQKHPVDGATFNGSPINIFFKIRSIGGSCPIYC